MAIRYTTSYNETIPFSDTCVQFNISANTAQTFTIPGERNQKFILTFGLPCSSAVWVGYNVAATVPVANTQTTTSGLEFITPGMQRYAIGGDVLSLNSADTTSYVGVSIRSIPN